MTPAERQLRIEYLVAHLHDCVRGTNAVGATIPNGKLGLDLSRACSADDANLDKIQRAATDAITFICHAVRCFGRDPQLAIQEGYDAYLASSPPQQGTI